MHGAAAHRLAKWRLTSIGTPPVLCGFPSSVALPEASESAVTSSSTRSPTSLLYPRATEEDFKLNLNSDSPVGRSRRFRLGLLHPPVFSSLVTTTTFLVPYF